MIPPIHLIGKLDSAGSPRTQGSNVARLLRGSWRKDDSGIVADPVDLTEAELTEITPTLCRSGAGALAWSKIRNTPLAATAAGRELHDVYRRFRLSALRHEREIAGVFSLLRAAGIEAVLVKGWAIARRYPDRALRPYGDIDLCVAPAQFAEASEVLAGLRNISGPFVDLHCGFDEVGRSRRREAGGKSWAAIFPRLGRRTVRKGYAFPVPVSSAGATPQESGGAASGSFMESDGKAQPYRTVRRQSRGVELDSAVASKRWNEVFARTLVVECGGEPVRILSDEDHLRILCLHLLRSGARRPTWLCDVALLLEQVQSPKSKVQRRADRVAVKDSSRGLSAFCYPPGSSHINDSDPAGVIESSPTSNVQSPSRSPTVREGSDGTLDHAGALPDGRASAWRADSSTGAAFDWDVCLGRNPVHANWVAAAIVLAHELLGADISKTPFADQQLPRWLVPAVLKQWGGRETVGRRQSAIGSKNIHRLWTVDSGLLTDLYSRWDNPIRATAAVGGKFNNWPRLPYRFLESIMRLPELPARVLGKRGKRGKGERLKGNAVRSTLIADC